jgi:hypothetical protein
MASASQRRIVNKFVGIISILRRILSMSKFGEKPNNAADNHQTGTAIAVFPTVDGNFKYVVDTEGYGALQSAEEELVALPANLM